MLISDLEQRIRLASIVSVASIISGVLIALGGIFFGYITSNQAQERIYVLDKDDKPTYASLTDKLGAADIEAKGHVKLFHQLFFTLSPDDNYIRRSLDEAMYLIDDSGVKQRNALHERGFYNDIITTSSYLSIKCDSIDLDYSTKSWVYYGTQIIDKRKSTTIRQLVTTGKLLEVARSENNPFGYIITDYKTLSNKDITKKDKTTI